LTFVQKLFNLYIDYTFSYFIEREEGGGPAHGKKEKEEEINWFFADANTN